MDKWCTWLFRTCASLVIAAISLCLLIYVVRTNEITEFIIATTISFCMFVVMFGFSITRMGELYKHINKYDEV